MRIIEFEDGFTSENEPTEITIAASQAVVTPSGNLASDNVQDALEEIQTEVDGNTTHATSTGNSHSMLASQLPFDNTDTDIVAVDVQEAIEELDDNLAALDSDFDDHVAATAAHGITGDVVGTTDSQALSNKELASPTISGTVAGDHTVSGAVTYSGTGANKQPTGTTAQRPGSASAGMFRFNSEASQFEGYDGSAWGSIGGATSNDNLLKGNSTADSGVGDWTVVGSGVTFAKNTTTPLGENSDFQLDKVAADRSGTYVKCAYVVPSYRRNQMAGLSFAFDGTDANYAAEDIEVVVYDVDNSQEIIPHSPADVYKLDNELSLVRIAYTPANSTAANYEVRVKIASTNATAYTVHFTDFKVHYGQVLSGFDGIWKPYTATDVVVTSAQGGWVTDTDSWFIPFKDSAGQWYLEFSIEGSYTAATIAAGGVTVTVPGVTFASDQAVAGFLSSTTNNTLRGAFASNGTGDVVVRPSSVGTTSFFYASGRVRLTSKPTWADFDPIATFYPTTDDLALGESRTVALTGSDFTNDAGLTIAGVTTGQRIGNSLHLTMNMFFSGTGTDAGAFTLALPSVFGSNIVIPSGFYGAGYYRAYNSSSTGRFPGNIAIRSTGGTNSLQFSYNNTTSLNGTEISTATSGEVESFTVTAILPVNGWDIGALSPIGLEMASATTPGIVKKNKFQKKTLASNFTTDGTISNLTFSNLTVGKWYRATVQANINCTTSDKAFVDIVHDSTTLAEVKGDDNDTTSQASALFKATATTITFVAGSVTAGTVIGGNGTYSSTWSMIEELNNYVEEVSEF